MAKSQLKGNREAKKPKQPKKVVASSPIGIPVKPIKPMTKSDKAR